MFRKKHLRAITGLLKIPLLAVLLAFMSACGAREPDPVTLDIVSLGTRGDQEMKVPHFVKSSETPSEADQLNEIVLDLENRYMAAGADPDRDMTLQTYVASINDSLLQATLISCETRDGLTEYTLYSLVYDNETGHVVTSQEALERAGLNGAELRQKAGRLFLEQNPSVRAENALRSTEVQGFVLNSKGQTTRIFIKFLVKNQSGADDPFFYAYSLTDGSLIPMHELGFSLP